MHSHVDADAFMRTYLEQPADATARLVFADWLEETGEPHSTAWAHFIRLKIEADRWAPGSFEYCERYVRAEEHAPQIRARLTIGAKLFVGYPKSLLQLLPAPNITVRLARFEAPPRVLELVPESVARENLTFPLDLQGDTLLAAAHDVRDAVLSQKLGFILNKQIVFVRAQREELQEAIDRHYGHTGAEMIDFVLAEFADVATDFAPPRPFADLLDDDISVIRSVHQIISEAARLHADSVFISPEPGFARIRYQVDGAWADRDTVPLRLLRGIAVRLAIIAAIPLEGTFHYHPRHDPRVGEVRIQVHNVHLHVRVSLWSSPDGPTVQIDLAREATTVP